MRESYVGKVPRSPGIRSACSRVVSSHFIDRNASMIDVGTAFVESAVTMPRTVHATSDIYRAGTRFDLASRSSRALLDRGGLRSELSTLMRLLPIEPRFQ